MMAPPETTSRKITAASFTVSGPHRFGVKDVTISIAATARSLDLLRLLVRYPDNTEAEPPVDDVAEPSPGKWEVSVTGFPSTAPVEKSTFILDLTIDGETITGFAIPPTGYKPPR
jgi:hypothetical protein